MMREKNYPAINVYNGFLRVVDLMRKSVNVRLSYATTKRKNIETHLLDVDLSGVDFYDQAVKSLKQDYLKFLNLTAEYSRLLRKSALKGEHLLDNALKYLKEILAVYSKLTGIIDLAELYRKHLANYEEKYDEIVGDIEKTASLFPQKYLGLFTEYESVAKKLSFGETVFDEMREKHEQLIASLKNDFGIDVTDKPAKRVTLKHGFIEAKDVTRMGLFRAVGINLRVLTRSEYNLGVSAVNKSEKRLVIKFYQNIEKKQLRFERDLGPIHDAWMGVIRAKGRNKDYSALSKKFCDKVKSVSYSSRIERATGRKVTGFKDAVERFVALYKQFSDDIEKHSKKVEGLKVIGGVASEKGFKNVLDQIDALINDVSGMLKAYEDPEIEALLNAAVNSGRLPKSFNEALGL